VEARRARGHKLTAGGNNAGDGKADRQVEEILDLVRRHEAPRSDRPLRFFAERARARHNILI
jgi:hypothetical protein